MLFLVSAAATANAQLRGVGAVSDNDFYNFWHSIAERPDHDYTAGTRVWLEVAGASMPLRPLVSIHGCTKSAACSTTTRFELGQEIHTPRRESDFGPVPDERPHAGYLYSKVELEVAAKPWQANHWIALGIVGPAALAEETQRLIHEWFEFREPTGWRFQLPNEPVLQIGSRVSRDIAARLSAATTVYASPYGAAQLGNHTVGVAAGLRLGVQEHTRSDNAADTPGWYLEVGVEPNLVIRNMLLDGTAWRASHSVAKEALVMRLHLGTGLKVGRVLVGFSVHRRSREYQTEPDGHTYSSISFTYIRR